MAKFVLFVQSQGKPGRDADYNRWYDEAHLPELLRVPGVTAGRRLKLAMAAMGAAPQGYATIYEVEAEDAGAFMAAMGQHMATNPMTDSDALDRSEAVMWIYQDMSNS